MQTSPLLYENASFTCSNRIMTGDEHQSYDTTIPFLDDVQRNSTGTRSCEPSIRQSRTRNWSHISERLMTDNESTVTVSNLRFTSLMKFFFFLALPTKTTR